ncbi:MAG: hypothetical protein JST81_01250 [Bacteroidetes bacterium]|jgi:hypothetical protein|nr:hypothetical protein [Bacteroidota bacterium]
MKKILFIAVAIAATTYTASAQQAKASPTIAPAPSKEQLAKDNQKKAESVDKMSATPAPKRKIVAGSTASYKKAGLTQEQITEVNKINADFDQRKAKMQNDNGLTPEQKKAGLEAIEAERNASVRKSMGDNAYKRYTLVNSTEKVKAKPVKTEKKN